MHATTEVCSIHNSHHTTLLGQLWDKITHTMAVKDNEYRTKEELIREEKRYQLQRQADRTADLHRIVTRIII